MLLHSSLRQVGWSCWVYAPDTPCLHGMRVISAHCLRQVERYVMRLLGAAQRRRDAREAPPYQAFARQDAAFRWADAHPLAAELRCGSPDTCPGLFTLSRMCSPPKHEAYIY